MALTPKDAPVQLLKHPLFDQHDVQVMIKREDLLHPDVSGNKWRKLKYNLAKAGEKGFDRILTFGGAYSNHLYATAAACHSLGFESIGVVRGEQHIPLNETLSFAARKGMHLHYVSREDYRNKDTQTFIKELEREYGAICVIPEGGANRWGVSGCMEILPDVDEPFDVVTVPCGTGSTLAGMVLSLEDGQKAIGFSALKGGSFLADEVEKHLCVMLDDSWLSPDVKNAYRIEDRYHFGGYGKYSDELMHFIATFRKDFDILLDPIYTGKMAFGLFELIKSGHFAPKTKILMIHTGGLQGWMGFKERFGISPHTIS